MDKIDSSGRAPDVREDPFDGAPSYEAPELVELATATELLQGLVMTQAYYDCPANDGTTRWQPNC